jgi:hypothetical protein
VTGGSAIVAYYGESVQPERLKTYTWNGAHRTLRSDGFRSQPLTIKSYVFDLLARPATRALGYRSWAVADCGRFSGVPKL